MTIMVPIPEDIKIALEKAFPSETVEQTVARVLRAEVERNNATIKARSEEIMEQFRLIRESGKPITSEEIHALRVEGRH